MSDPLIKFKIIESKGFSKHEKPADEAFEYIKDYMQKNQSWLYINGTVTNFESLTKEMVKDADSISINNIIIGGCGDLEN
jgi:hypothetical protein